MTTVITNPDDVANLYTSLKPIMQNELKKEFRVNPIPLALTNDYAKAIGVVYPGWLGIDLIWVNPTQRGLGIGSEILKELERQAIARGAHSAYAYTQNFEAPGFYRINGYKEFFQLTDFHPGQQMLGFRKYLLGA